MSAGYLNVTYSEGGTVNILEWAFQGVGVTILIALSMIIKNKISDKNKRISDAVSEYSRIYKRDGCRLECLMPSGIHTLKNNKEIKIYFSKVMEIEPYHPLRSWKTDIEEIGLKKFFHHVFKSGHPLNKGNINSFINELKACNK